MNHAEEIEAALERKTQPTPGPWKVHGYHVRAVGRGILDCCIVDRAEGNDAEEAAANARLIAAAPDLLAALERIEKGFDGSGEYTVNGLRGIARAALAKAKGGS